MSTFFNYVDSIPLVRFVLLSLGLYLCYTYVYEIFNQISHQDICIYYNSIWCWWFSLIFNKLKNSFIYIKIYHNKVNQVMYLADILLQ